MKTIIKHAPSIFAAVIGLVGAALLCNWSACEQDDSVCMFTGESSK